MIVVRQEQPGNLYKISLTVTVAMLEFLISPLDASFHNKKVFARTTIRQVGAQALAGRNWR